MELQQESHTDHKLRQLLFTLFTFRSSCRGARLSHFFISDYSIYWKELPDKMAAGASSV